MEKNNSSTPRVVFYTSVPRLFRTTLIGHLYEISQVYPVVLLSEELDSETEEILDNKDLFPKLEEIVPVRQYTGQKVNLLVKNKYLYRLAKNIVEQYEPDIVTAANDLCPFEMYLMRLAKKKGALRVCLQAGLLLEPKELQLWAILFSTYKKLPYLPYRIKFFLIKNKRYLQHIIYYYILPLIVGEKPFWGKTSFILHKGPQGTRDADFSIVFSKRDYDLAVRNGVAPEKLYVLPHPLVREPRSFLKKIYSLNLNPKINSETKILTLMFPLEEIGIRKKDLSLISKEQIKSSRIRVIKLISRILNGWRIFIKPHPMVQEVDKLKKMFASISAQVEVVNPQEAADKYIEISKVIAGLPPASTTLFTALLQDPEKIVLSLNLNQELLGDAYEDFNGIEYIDTEEKLIDVLELIQSNNYSREHLVNSNESRFSGIVELLEYLLLSKKRRA